MRAREPRLSPRNIAWNISLGTYAPARRLRTRTSSGSFSPEPSAPLPRTLQPPHRQRRAVEHRDRRHAVVLQHPNQMQAVVDMPRGRLHRCRRSGQCRCLSTRRAGRACPRARPPQAMGELTCPVASSRAHEKAPRCSHAKASMASAFPLNSFTWPSLHGQRAVTIVRLAGGRDRRSICSHGGGGTCGRRAVRRWNALPHRSWFSARAARRPLMPICDGRKGGIRGCGSKSTERRELRDNIQ